MCRQLELWCSSDAAWDIAAVFMPQRSARRARGRLGEHEGEDMRACGDWISKLVTKTKFYTSYGPNSYFVLANNEFSFCQGFIPLQFRSVLVEEM